MESSHHQQSQPTDDIEMQDDQTTAEPVQQQINSNLVVPENDPNTKSTTSELPADEQHARAAESASPQGMTGTSAKEEVNAGRPSNDGIADSTTTITTTAAAKPPTKTSHQETHKEDELIDTAVPSKPNQTQPAAATNASQPSTNGEHPQNGAETRLYLQGQVNEWLLQGMRWLAYTRPKDGLLGLAQYLQSAHDWRSNAVNDGKDSAEFHKYWLSYQAWLVTSSEKSETDFKNSLRSD